MHQRDFSNFGANVAEVKKARLNKINVFKVTPCKFSIKIEKVE